VALSSPTATTPGQATLIDAFGDTVLAQATLANNPFAFTLSTQGYLGYNLNGNENATGINAGVQGSFTLDSYTVTTGSTSTSALRTEGVSTSTIVPDAYPFNMISTTNALYVIEPYVNPSNGFSSTSASTKGTANLGFVGELTGAHPALQQEIGVAPDPVSFAGASAAPRIYVLSQGNSTSGALANANDCSTPGTVTTNGEADSLEVTTNTISNRLPVGICPVFGIASPDLLRAYVLNRGNGSAGSGTITVINAQSNSLDLTIPNNNGSPTITVGTGPVYADLYPQSQLLVTANYDSDTVSVINVPTDIYGNDGPTFGTVKTISLRTTASPAAKGPIALTILRDGSRAYVANQLDGTVSVVNLTTFEVTKTIQLPPGANATTQASETNQPRSIASVFSTPTGAVYVASTNSKNLTVINTETDTVATSVLLQAPAVSVNSTVQNVSSTSLVNAIVTSSSSGLGVPCAPSDTSPFCPQSAQ
jgi:YVTN family beta-propeller protein